MLDVINTTASICKAAQWEEC